MVSGPQRCIAVDHNGNVKSTAHGHQDSKSGSGITGVKDADGRFESAGPDTYHGPRYGALRGLVVLVAGNVQRIAVLIQIGDLDAHLAKATPHGNDVLSCIGHAVKNHRLFGLRSEGQQPYGVAFGGR